MSTQGFKSELFDQFARVGKALSNGHRLEIIEFLAQGAHSVETLARKTGLSIANTSKHLQILRQAGLVEARKHGVFVYYRLAGDDVLELLNALRTVARRHLAEVDRLIQTYLSVKDELEPVPPDELMQRLNKGLVTVIDVRPEDEYAAGHVPGAINIPLSDLEARLEKLDADGEYVAYCRGPHCVLAFDAVQRLREKGYQARRLQDGMPEWKQAGLPVEEEAV